MYLKNNCIEYPQEIAAFIPVLVYWTEVTLGGTVRRITKFSISSRPVIQNEEYCQKFIAKALVLFNELKFKQACRIY